jgi:hypothetical protein
MWIPNLNNIVAQAAQWLRYRLAGWRIVAWFPSGHKICLFCLPTQRVPAVCPPEAAERRSRREANQSALLSADVNDEWRYNFTRAYTFMPLRQNQNRGREIKFFPCPHQEGIQEA